MPRKGGSKLLPSVQQLSKLSQRSMNVQAKGTVFSSAAVAKLRGPTV